MGGGTVDTTGWSLYCLNDNQHYELLSAILGRNFSQSRAGDKNLDAGGLLVGDLRKQEEGVRGGERERAHETVPALTPLLRADGHAMPALRSRAAGTKAQVLGLGWGCAWRGHSRLGEVPCPGPVPSLPAPASPAASGTDQRHQRC